MRGGVRSSVDIGRLANAVSRPGVDPRIWIVMATVLDVAFDSEHGMYADVQLIPEGQKETCLIGSNFAGKDCGEWDPPDVNDIVLVAIPMGDFGAGPVIFQRLWTATEPPPAEFGDDSTAEPTDATRDHTIVVRKGRRYRVVARDGSTIKFDVSGAGKLEINATGPATVEVHAQSAIIIDGPDVRLGKTPGQPVARVGDLVAVSLPPMVAGITPVTQVPPTGPTIQAVGQIVSGAGTVKA